MLEKKKVGLAVGFFLAIVHAVWSLAVAVIPSQLQSFLGWVFKLHAIQPVWVLMSFNFVNAVILVILTFVIGYIIGWVFAWIHNMLHKR